MNVNFFLKEDIIIQESVSITVMRSNDRGRNQVINTIPIDKMSKSEQKIIETAIGLLEKYSQEQQGAIQIRYNL